MEKKNDGKSGGDGPKQDSDIYTWPKFESQSRSQLSVPPFFSHQASLPPVAKVYEHANSIGGKNQLGKAAAELPPIPSQYYANAKIPPAQPPAAPAPAAPAAPVPPVPPAEPHHLQQQQQQKQSPPRPAPSAARSFYVLPPPFRNQFAAAFGSFAKTASANTGTSGSGSGSAIANANANMDRRSSTETIPQTSSQTQAFHLHNPIDSAVLAPVQALEPEATNNRDSGFSKERRRSSSAESANESSRKTRKRLSVSCKLCRKKKIKCDRERPICGSCKKNGIPSHLCIYDDSPWISSLVKEQNYHTEIEHLKAENIKLSKLIEEEDLKISKLKNNYQDLYGKDEITKVQTTNTIKAKSEQILNNIKSQKLDIKNFVTINSNEIPAKNFAILTWQNFQYQDKNLQKFVPYFFESWKIQYETARDSDVRKPSTELFNFSEIFKVINLNCTKYTNIDHSNLKPNKNDFYGKKLQELSKALPCFKILEKKFKNYFKMNFDVLIHKFFNNDIMIKDFYRIFKKSRKGGVEINVYEPSRDYHIELLKLATILICIKIGILFSDNDNINEEVDFNDPENLLVKYAIACIFLSDCVHRPSIPSINFLTLLALYKIYSEEDQVDLLYSEYSNCDYSIISTLLLNMCVGLGLYKEYDDINESLKNENDCNNNFIDREYLKNIWKNLMLSDIASCYHSGLSLLLPGLDDYTKIKTNSPTDRGLKDVVFIRHIYNKFSITSEEQGEEMTRLDLEKELNNVFQFFHDVYGLESNFWQNVEDCTSLSIKSFKIAKILSLLGLADLAASLEYLLYLSYSDQNHHLNAKYEHQELVATEEDQKCINNLKNKFMNSSLLHCIFSLRIMDWVCDQELNSSNKIFLDKASYIVAKMKMKNSIMKTLSILFSTIFSNSLFDEYGLVFDNCQDLANNNPVEEDLFDMSLIQLEELSFKMNDRDILYFKKNFLYKISNLLSSFYEKIQKISLFTNDSCWFNVYKEYHYIINYLIYNKRKFNNNGQINYDNLFKVNDENHNEKLLKVFDFPDYLSIKEQLEKTI